VSGAEIEFCINAVAPNSKDDWLSTFGVQWTDGEYNAFGAKDEMKFNFSLDLATNERKCTIEDTKSWEAKDAS